MWSKIFKKLDTWLTAIEEWALFIIVIAALLSLFTNVVLRYGFNYTLAWSEELVRIVIICSTFIGTSVAIKQRAMIRIDAIVQIFPKLTPVLTLYTNLLMLIFTSMMVYYGYQMALLQFSTHQKTIIMQIPLVYIYAIMPVMGIIASLRVVQVIREDILTQRGRHASQ